MEGGQGLAQGQVAAGRGEHGGEEGEGGEAGQVAPGRVVEEDAVAGGAAQQRHIQQASNVAACSLWDPKLQNEVRNTSAIQAAGRQMSLPAVCAHVGHDKHG